ncbi:hypothetical protein FocTR4_00012276 [Fusarium oxysporum f. sp. cubense]|uniref:Uncharacterized protein n=1 Tax=Fusarium oxysporum f. sp. cubense TaxID=61366 RepID=A0A5C6SF31_FUSOC|nr:hypothetical protein FocTR4_00012276 [Fusarium oxysporum f. sp. cubense]
MKISYASVIMAAVSPVAAAVECKQTKKPGLASFEGTGGSAFDGKYNKNNNDFWYSRPKNLATKDGVLRIANISDHLRIVYMAKAEQSTLPRELSLRERHGNFQLTTYVCSEEWNNGTKEVKTGDRLRQGTKRLPGYHQTFT